MGTTATERPQTRSKLARMAGIGPVSPVSILGGLLVGYAAFGILLGAAVALLQGRSSTLDLTQGWEKLGAGGGVLIGVLLFLAYLLAGYMTGRMAWRQGVLHGIGVFVASLVVGAVIVAVVKAVTAPKDVKAITDALHSFGIPTTRSKWRDVDSVLPIASVVGMFLGSVLGAVAGERWYTRVSRRVLAAEAGEIDVREPHSTPPSPNRTVRVAATASGTATAPATGTAPRATTSTTSRRKSSTSGPRSATSPAGPR